MAKKKRKWTAAEKQAFARRMKKARKAKSGGGKTSKPKRKKAVRKSTVKKSTRKPAAKKTATRKTKKTGATMAKKKAKKSGGGGNSKKRRGGRRGFGKGFKKANMVGAVKQAAIAIGGGILAGVVANKLPIKDARIKAAAPAVAGMGLLLTMGQKNPIVRDLATGMMVLGGVAAIRAAFPNVPLLAGEDEVVLSPEMIGYDPDYSDIMGVENFGVEDFGADGQEVYVSPATL